MEERRNRSPAGIEPETFEIPTNPAIPDNPTSVNHTQTADSNDSETEQEEVYRSSVGRSGDFASHVTGGILDEYLQEKLAPKDPRSEALSDHKNLVGTVLRTVSLIQDLDGGDRSAGLENYKNQLIQTLDKTYQKFLTKFAVDRLLAVRLAHSDSKDQIREKLLHPLNLLRLAGQEADSAEYYRIFEYPDGVHNLAALCCVVTNTRDSLVVIRILQTLATCSREHLNTMYFLLFCEFVFEIIMNSKRNHQIKIYAVRVLKSLSNDLETVGILLEYRLLENVLAAMASVPAEERNNAKCAEFYMEVYELIVALTRLRTGFQALLASAAVYISESFMPRTFVELLGRLIENRKATFGWGSGNQEES